MTMMFFMLLYAYIFSCFILESVFVSFTDVRVYENKWALKANVEKILQNEKRKHIETFFFQFWTETTSNNAQRLKSKNMYGFLHNGAKPNNLTIWKNLCSLFCRSDLFLCRSTIVQNEVFPFLYDRPSCIEKVFCFEWLSKIRQRQVVV